ncbi:uncharacterized protein BX664DRAFT_339079 [Halteromyces radiatus]|uniref:uncharacterized protein n=1 Tax=Halteromyces radiatus TaxID=101107 RepID=UPI00221EA79D|nr:uncharacterized protein BX664DRAFT_339079 [Halteromyces radiatus]KAI8082791.1 hypothetical protein BX664DRAFT_339079 [Halteromyces radiatus]
MVNLVENSDDYNNKDNGDNTHLSDETIDQLGYARLTAASLSCAPASSITATSPTAIFVTGPTKSPPPVLMPRPRPAVHPTLKLTSAFSEPDPISLPSITTVPLTTTIPPKFPEPTQHQQEEEYESPEQPPSTYLTPPLASPLSMPLQKTNSIPSKVDSTNLEEKPQVAVEQQSSSPTSTKRTSPSTTKNISNNSNNNDNNDSNHTLEQRITSSSSSSAETNSNLNRHQQPTSKKADPVDNQSSSERRNQHSGILPRKPPVSSSGHSITVLTTSTSAPIIPSPLVKSTLASQLSNSSSSSSSSSSFSSSSSSRGSTKKQSSSQPSRSSHPSEPPSSHHQRLQRPIRKSMSSEHLQKTGPFDLYTSSPATTKQQHAGIIKEKVPYIGKPPTRQQQQDYLLRQNSLLRRQVDALRFDNWESQRQHQELALRLKYLEAQLAEKRQATTGSVNEYQHHHYYHHHSMLSPEDVIKKNGKVQRQQYGFEMNDDTKKNNDGDNDSMEEELYYHHHHHYHQRDKDEKDQRRNSYDEEEQDEIMDNKSAVDNSKHYMEYQETIPRNEAINNSQPYQPTTKQKRPIYQRRHSSYISPTSSISDSVLSPNQRVQRQQRPEHELHENERRHATFPLRRRSINQPVPIQERQRQQQSGGGSRRQRSRSVPKNSNIPLTPSSQQKQQRLYHYQPRQHYPQQQHISDFPYDDDDVTYLDNEDVNDNSSNYMMPNRAMLPPILSRELDNGEEDMDDGFSEESDPIDDMTDDISDDYYGYDVNRAADDDDDDDEYFDDDDDDDDHVEAILPPRNARRMPPPPLNNVYSMFYPPYERLPPPNMFMNDPYFDPRLHPFSPPIRLRRQRSATAPQQIRRNLSTEFRIPMHQHYLRRPPKPPVGGMQWNPRPSPSTAAAHTRQLQSVRSPTNSQRRMKPPGEGTSVSARPSPRPPGSVRYNIKPPPKVSRRLDENHTPNNRSSRNYHAPSSLDPSRTISSPKVKTSTVPLTSILKTSTSANN